MALQTFTSEDIYAIRTALLIARKTDLLLSDDAYFIESALPKIEDVIDKRCMPQRHSEFVLLPLLAENNKE